MQRLAELKQTMKSCGKKWCFLAPTDCDSYYEHAAKQKLHQAHQCVRSFCDASTASETQSVHSLIITRTQCEQKRCTIAHIAVLAQPSCSQSHSLTVEQCVRASVHEDSHPPTDAQFAELHIEDSHADRGASCAGWSLGQR